MSELAECLRKCLRKYLRNYAEPETHTVLDTSISERWNQVLVIPAYDESPDALNHLNRFQNLLLVLVLNHPDTDRDSTGNDALRSYLSTLQCVWMNRNASVCLRALPTSNHVLVVERADALPHKQGVGLARKIGCDLALALCASGNIASDWIHCSDADAILPKDYFAASEAHLTAAALTYPFTHTQPNDNDEHAAIELYERYLRSYVEGLRRAGSAYAFHTIGSCIAVKAEAYAKVRGFPRRAAGEDFYLLNKVAKLGPVVTPSSHPVELSARLSGRVPFGTGPALTKLLANGQLQDTPLFYHPACYDRLAAVLTYVNTSGTPTTSLRDFETALTHHPKAFLIIKDLGLESFLRHAKRQCADKRAFATQFHQWLDAFKTLKFIHALTEDYPKLSASQAHAMQTDA